MRLPGTRLIPWASSIVVLLLFEWFLYYQAFHSFVSTILFGQVYFADAMLMWVVYNVMAVSLSGPAAYTLKVTDKSVRNGKNWSSRLRHWGAGLAFGFAGTMLGAFAGFALGGIVGYVIESPASHSMHNLAGYSVFFYAIAVMLVGAIAGYLAGLVQFARRARAKIGNGAEVS